MVDKLNYNSVEQNRDESLAGSRTSRNGLSTLDKSSTPITRRRLNYMMFALKTCAKYQISVLGFLHDLFRIDTWCRKAYSENNLWFALFNKTETLPQNHWSWQQVSSIFLLKVLWMIKKPLKALGDLLEWVLNLIQANGGVILIIYRLLSFWKSEIVIRRRGDENFATILAIMDQRNSLLHDQDTRIKRKHDRCSEPGGGHSFSFPGTDLGSRETADVMVMASKLAYESKAYTRRVINTLWKMNFVGFYDCWNEYHKQADTQVLLLTERPTKAKAIVLAFRGTEPFNAIDWSTDFDFSWFQLEGLGKVHVGFLEALGLGDRKSIDTFSLLQQHAQSKLQVKNVCGSRFSGLGEATVNESRKILAYDNMTDKIKQLMEENPEAKLFVTGHSLGGALAALYTTLLFYNNDTIVTDRLGALYTFGQPRVGDDEFSQYMITKIGEDRYFRVVYSNDLVPRIPFDDKLFRFKHGGLCYYFNARYDEETLREAPHANFFSFKFLSRLLSMRLVALYELVQSFFLSAFYGEDYKESLTSTIFRTLGLLVPGISAHGLTNYINAIRLGPSPLVAKVSASDLHH